MYVKFYQNHVDRRDLMSIHRHLKIVFGHLTCTVRWLRSVSSTFEGSVLPLLSVDADKELE